MPLFLDTTGQPTLGIGICDRCRRKFPLAKLKRDRDNPGLLVCADDNDLPDPYKLPPRAPEQIHLRTIRPDTDISIRYVKDLAGNYVQDENGDYIEEEG